MYEETVQQPVSLSFTQSPAFSWYGGECGKLISPLNLLWETMKTAQVVKNYFNLVSTSFNDEKILDFMLARFQNLLIEGLRKDKSSNKNYS